MAGTYEEIFNSDDEKYGGSGVINRKPLVSDRIDWNGRQSSIELKVPPLGITILRRTLQTHINFKKIFCKVFICKKTVFY